MCLGNPDPCDTKVDCSMGKETIDDDETTEEASSRGDLRWTPFGGQSEALFKV